MRAEVCYDLPMEETRTENDIPRIKRRVAVRTLVETVLLSGSLSRDASARRMLEGIRGHQAIQSVAEEGVENEVSVSLTVSEGGIELTVYGRIDRLHGETGVEEIKTTLGVMEDERAIPAQHWAQAMCYAHMLCAAHGYAGARVQLTYMRLSTGEITEFARDCTAEALKEAFDGLLNVYISRLIEAAAHARQLSREAAAAAFPFDAFRDGQRTLAEQAYTAIRKRETLLAEAPTGTGKTIAVLYPAVKALGAGETERVFYLTARTTQQRAAEDAVEKLGVHSLRSVVLSARDKMCVHDTPVCASGDCPRADGYYDRLSDALNEAARAGGHFTRSRIRALADQFLLCPFELSLDLSSLCDLIICDYNYAFDPRVRLQRYFQRGRQKQALLIDEAHNLPDRARGMYSASISKKNVREARLSVPKAARKSPLCKTLSALEKAMEACFPEDAPSEGFASPEPPLSLRAAAETAAEALNAQDMPAARDLARQLAFDLSGFLYILNQYGEGYATLYEGGKTVRRVTLFCADPSKNLADVYKKCAGAVLFSATLAPFPFYRQLSGLAETAPMLRLPSPFPPANLLVLQRSLSLRYRARERTLPLVAETCAAFVGSRENGNFLIFLPSHAYLAAVLPALSERLPNAVILAQQGEMDDAARAAFLDAFSPAPQGLTVGLAVLGGVFAEGIDLPAERLCGAAVVGVGLPQVGLEREVLRDAYETSYGAGFDYAYRYPGMGKVLQAAGRVIRTETDRGALLLIDDRYTAEETRALLPERWRVERVFSAEETAKRAKAFWNA